MDGFKLHRFHLVFHLNNYIIWNDTIIFSLKITLEITETDSFTFFMLKLIINGCILS